MRVGKRAPLTAPFGHTRSESGNGGKLVCPHATRSAASTCAGLDRGGAQGIPFAVLLLASGPGVTAAVRPQLHPIGQICARSGVPLVLLTWKSHACCRLELLEAAADGTATLPFKIPEGEVLDRRGSGTDSRTSALSTRPGGPCTADGRPHATCGPARRPLLRTGNASHPGI